MERTAQRLYLAGDKGISEISPDGRILKRAPLEGACAICAGEETVFCADASGAIWQLNRDTLMPESICAGGPGVCDLCLSLDESRLYVLLGDADSVMMIDCKTGRPMFVNRCGCNPAQIQLYGDFLVAAGGESGAAHLYDTDTLTCQKEIPMPGPVQSVAMEGEALYALCLTPQLNTMLVAMRGKKRQTLHLQGMPGSLLIHENCLYAATLGSFHVFDSENLRLLERASVPGRPSRMYIGRKGVIAYDPLSQHVYALQADQRWKVFGSRINAVCMSADGKTDRCTL